MNISYNWLKEYLDFDLEPEEVAAALTSIGLETGGVEEVQTIKGGLEGLVELLAGIPGRGGGTYPVQDVAEPGDGEGQGEQLRLGETGDEGEQEDQPARHEQRLGLGEYLEADLRAHVVVGIAGAGDQDARRNGDEQRGDLG